MWLMRVRLRKQRATYDLAAALDHLRQRIQSTLKRYAYYLITIDRRRKAFLLLWWILTVSAYNPENLLAKWRLVMLWNKRGFFLRRVCRRFYRVSDILERAKHRNMRKIFVRRQVVETIDYTSMRANVVRNLVKASQGKMKSAWAKWLRRKHFSDIAEL
jgi:hypothetical protein